ncbi:LysR family transcriptional regulator [Rhodococcoides fascians]|uniref:LysR family transcriptional regulator n=1 Tax=Rhodococcoides fascians TaxID=1828 RepID=UPI00050CE1B3|nr:LysR family transcriptional regulator [Rhodococcus fascians]
MELRTLSYFRSVARTKSVSVAALECSVSQPAISRQIASLEREVGARLFQRTSAGMILTAAGEKLFEMASDILSRAGRAEDVMRTLYTDKPAFRVACLEATSSFIVAPFIAETGVPITDVVTVMPEDAYPTLDGTIDMVVSTFPPSAGHASLMVARVPVTVQRNTVFGSETVDLDQLPCAEITMPGYGSAVETTVLDLAHRRGIRLDMARVTRTGTIAQALAAASGSTAVVTEPAQYGLHSRPLFTDGNAVSVSLHAVWSPDHYAAAHLAKIADKLSLWLTARHPWTGR